jgi:Ni,Fe-hydrogenase I cytochrome b subunit
MVMVSATTPFFLATTARSRVSAGASLMVRAALDNVHIAATIALTVALLSRLVARPLKALFVPSAMWWWCTISG